MIDREQVNPPPRHLPGDADKKTPRIWLCRLERP